MIVYGYYHIMVLLNVVASGETVIIRSADSNPSLAELGEGLLFQFGVGLAFLATIRKDGAPRLHPVCPVLSNEGLYVLVIPNLRKYGICNEMAGTPYRLSLKLGLIQMSST